MQGAMQHTLKRHYDITTYSYEARVGMVCGETMNASQGEISGTKEECVSTKEIEEK